MLAILLFALGIGSGLGYRGDSFAFVVIASCVLAAILLWRTRDILKKTTQDAWDGQATGPGPTGGAVMIYAALVGLNIVVAGLGYLLGRWLHN